MAAFPFLALAAVLLSAAGDPKPSPSAAASPAPVARAVLSFADDEAELSLSGPDKQAIKARIGAELPAGSLVRTRKSGAELQLLPSGSVIKLAANTSFRVLNLAAPGKGGDNEFELVAGTVRMVAAKALTGDAGYAIRTASAVCAVRGTDFARRYDPAEKKDWLCVLEGMIDFSSPDGKQALLVNGGYFVNLSKAWQAEPVPQAWLDTNLAEIKVFKTALPVGGR